jgi:hypothetical protein
VVELTQLGDIDRTGQTRPDACWAVRQSCVAAISQAQSWSMCEYDLGRANEGFGILTGPACAMHM